MKEKKSPRPGTLNKLCWQVAQERGNKSEKLVEEALSSLAPPLVLGWRKATPEEDSRGIDFVVNTSVGDVFLQVKSSRTASRNFLSVRRRTHIEVVVASGDVAARVKGAIERAVHAVKQRRGP
jgi:hypothetical protein